MELESGPGSVFQQSTNAVSSWLDQLVAQVGADRWSVGVRDGKSWVVRSPSPALQDDVISELLATYPALGTKVAVLLKATEIEPHGARLQATGIDHLLILPGGNDARIILFNPSADRSHELVASPAPLGPHFDLASAIRAEDLAGDLLQLIAWWPEADELPSTKTLEGTLLVGRMANASRQPKASGTESTRNSLLRERSRIASVIHEGITQVLTNIAVNLEVVKHVADQPDTVREMAATSRTAVLEALESLRTVILDLTPPSDDWADLVGGLSGFVADFESQWGIGVAVTTHGTPRELDSEIVSLVFAFVQEGLTNVRRHAATQSAEVDVTFTRDQIAVEVRDEGRGVQEANESDLRLHQGLKIMESRVRLLDGEFSFTSEEGVGTTVRIEVPA